MNKFSLFLGIIGALSFSSAVMASDYDYLGVSTGVEVNGSHNVSVFGKLGSKDVSIRPVVGVQNQKLNYGADLTYNFKLGNYDLYSGVGLMVKNNIVDTNLVLGGDSLITKDLGVNLNVKKYFKDTKSLELNIGVFTKL